MGIRNWLRSKLQNFLAENEGSVPISVHESNAADIEGLRFTVMPARGGTIIQVRTYDNRNDETHYTTYVISEGADVAEEVGRIVSMEMMKGI
jgi:histidine ammonia-lyase